MVKQLDYDSVDWSQFFYYDTSSKSCLKWNVNRYSGKNKNVLMAEKGQEIGTLYNQAAGQPAGWGVELTSEGKRTAYRVHRIIAVLHGMKVNDFVIDHIDGNPLNNCIENLRVTTQAVNNRNKKVRFNSPYGIAGVTFHRNGNNDEFWARYMLNGKEKAKTFSIRRLGIMEAFKQAVIYRQRAIIELNAQGCDYSARHTVISTASSDYDTYSKYEPKPFLKINNTSGFEGVYFETNNYGNLYATTTWVEHGKRKRKSFSTKIYGLIPAFTMAVTHRKNMVKEFYKD